MVGIFFCFIRLRAYITTKLYQMNKSVYLDHSHMYIPFFGDYKEYPWALSYNHQFPKAFLFFFPFILKKEKTAHI